MVIVFGNKQLIVAHVAAISCFYNGAQTGESLTPFASWHNTPLHVHCNSWGLMHGNYVYNHGVSITVFGID